MYYFDENKIINLNQIVCVIKNSTVYSNRTEYEILFHQRYDKNPITVSFKVEKERDDKFLEITNQLRKG